jgi:hypothetical protein
MNLSSLKAMEELTGLLYMRAAPQSRFRLERTQSGSKISVQFMYCFVQAFEKKVSKQYQQRHKCPSGNK